MSSKSVPWGGGVNVRVAEEVIGDAWEAAYASSSNRAVSSIRRWSAAARSGRVSQSWTCQRRRQRSSQCCERRPCISIRQECGAKVAYRSLICLAMVKNACSTFVAFLADVSKKGIESWSAKSWERVPRMSRAGNVT